MRSHYITVDRIMMQDLAYVSCFIGAQLDFGSRASQGSPTLFNMRLIAAACIVGASFQLAAATVDGQAHFGSAPLTSPDTNFDSEGRETFVGHQVWRLDVSKQQDVVKRQVMDVLDVSGSGSCTKGLANSRPAPQPRHLACIARSHRCPRTTHSSEHARNSVELPSAGSYRDDLGSSTSR